MDYKKIIAATAVTSAAFVVPAVVDAANEAQENDLFVDGTYMSGDTVKPLVTEFKENVIVDGITSEVIDKVKSYEWFIGASTTPSAKTAEFKLPVQAEGNEIKLVVTTEGDKKYYKTIRIPGKSDKLLTQDTYFEGDEIKAPTGNVEVNTSSNGTVATESITDYEWYVDGVKTQTGISFTVSSPVGKEVKLVVTTGTGKKLYKTVQLIAKKSELITDTTYTYGDTLKSSITEISTGDTTDKIVKYEWVYKNTTTSSALNNGLILPIDAIKQTLKLIVTTQSGAKYFDEVTISDMPPVEITYAEPVLVNSTLIINSLDIKNEDEIITGYEWYLVEDEQYKLLKGQNELDLDIPIEYSGKKVMFVVKTQSGTMYKKEIDVTPLKVLDSLDFTVKVNGISQEDYDSLEYVPGDKIEIKLSELEGENGEKLTAEDYNVQYSWIAINGNNNKFALANEKSNNFVVPSDSTKKDYKSFNATIVVKVPAIDKSLSKDLEFGEVNTETIPELIGEIERLSTSTSFDTLKSEVESIQEAYNKLNSSAKTSITNYAKLTEFLQALKVVPPLVEQLTKLEKSYKDYLSDEESSIKQAELFKSANTLRQSYNKLTKIQQEILDNSNSTTITMLYEWIVKLDDNELLYSSTKAVKDFNTKVEENVFNSTHHEYKLELELELELGSDEINLAALTDLEKVVKLYLDEVKTIDKAYQALLKTDALKMAQSDIKKARSVIEKIKKISTITDKKKQAAAIIAAEKAYNKLNIAQTTLISEATLKLTNPSTDNTEESEAEEDDQVTSVNEKIDELQSPSMTIDDLELTLSEIAVDYKLLSSAQKKLVTNYKTVSAVKKDVSAAKNVAKAILKAEEAKADADSFETDEKRSKYISKMKSAQSKYNSAYKSYAKLTATQKALVDGVALEAAVKAVTEIVDKVEFAGKQEYVSDKAAAVVTKIDDIQKNISRCRSSGFSRYIRSIRFR